MRIDRAAGPTAQVRVPATSANLGPGFDSLGLALAVHDHVRLTELDGLLRGVDLDVDVHPGPELAEALVLAGRVRDARPVVEAYAARAERKGQPWGRARAARARGLLAEPPESDVLFTEAAALHARTPDHFEGARTALLHGELLRRARRRVDARVPLRSALTEFERLGALPWAERAARAKTTRRTSADAISSASDLKWRSSEAARGAYQARTYGEALAGTRSSGSNAAARSCAQIRSRLIASRLWRRVLTRMSRQLKAATSTPTASCPDSRHWTSVVPEPANGSSTRPPGATYRSSSASTSCGTNFPR